MCYGSPGFCLGLNHSCNKIYTVTLRAHFYHIIVVFPCLRSPGTGRKKEAFEEGVLPGNLAERRQREKFWESFVYLTFGKGVLCTDRKSIIWLTSEHSCSSSSSCWVGSFLSKSAGDSEKTDS